jgi:hypothetical protein
MSTRTRLCLLAAAILVAYPLAAWIIGFIVEGELQARLQQGLQQAGSALSGESMYLSTQRTYSRGVFGASEVLTVTPKGRGTQSTAAPPEVEGLAGLAYAGVTVRNIIRRGPFQVAVLSLWRPFNRSRQLLNALHARASM